MQAASLRQSRRGGLEELPGPELVALLRALAACTALQPRIMTGALLVLQEARDGPQGYAELKPVQLQALLEALAILRPTKRAPEHQRLLEHVACSKHFSTS